MSKRISTLIKEDFKRLTSLNNHECKFAMVVGYDVDSIEVFCPYCGAIHVHGGKSTEAYHGTRVAHCQEIINDTCTSREYIILKQSQTHLRKSYVSKF